MKQFALSLIAGVLTLSNLSGYIAGPPETTFTSKNGIYVFKLTIGEGVGKCDGTLYKITGKKEKEIWSRRLINDYYPNRVRISDDGKYVITIGGHYEDSHDLAIYMDGGQLRRVLWVHGLVGARGDLISFFNKENTFYYTFHPSGDLIVLDLKGARIIYPNRMFRDDYFNYYTDHFAYATDRTKEIALQYLQSKDKNRKVTGARFARLFKMKEAIPELKKLLTSDVHTFHIGNESRTKVYYLRIAARDALMKMDVDFPNDIIFEEIEQDGRENGRKLK